MTSPTDNAAFARLFDPRSISADTQAVNDRLAAVIAVAAVPDDLAAMRAAYATGGLGLPVQPQSARARTMTIPGPAGDIALRIIVPDAVCGVYLHVHGGGWTLGDNAMQDGLLEQIGAAAGLAAVSVDYRLAPEHPFPAPVDDIVAAAEWLIDNAAREFGTSWLAIGGESAGAHLAASTLIRLRDAGRVDAFRAANLTFGCFDLSLTPSARRTHGSPFIDPAILTQMATGFAGPVDRSDPAISPLHADLTGLPPALFTIGTADPLLDDSLFMHMRWLAAGNLSELAVYPGGVHGFHLLGGEIADAANRAIGAFLARHRDAA